MTPGQRHRAAFTLVEVLIALSLLGIGLLGLAAMQLTAFEYGGRGRHLSKAAAVAEARMEELMRKRWTDMALAPTSGWTAPVIVNNAVQVSASALRTEQSYAVSWRIADLDPGRTRAIDVRVAWDEPKRPGRQYALSSVRFNHEAL